MISDLNAARTASAARAPKKIPKPSNEGKDDVSKLLALQKTK